jgi:Spy/CpxP family protein refolding chaperone
MKIKNSIILLFLFISLPFFAQSDKMKDKKEQIKTMKVAFFTTELDLSSKEAQRFWPIYNDFDNSQFEIRHEKMKVYKSQMNDVALSDISEKDASALVSKMEDSDEELFLLRKKFTKELRDILPAVKILKLRKAEEDFNRKLLHQYRARAHQK